MEALAVYPLSGYFLATDRESRVDALDYESTCKQLKRPAIVGYQHGAFVKVDFSTRPSGVLLNELGIEAVRDVLQRECVNSSELFLGTSFYNAQVPLEKWPYVAQKLLSIWQDPDNRISVGGSRL